MPLSSCLALADNPLESIPGLRHLLPAAIAPRGSRNRAGPAILVERPANPHTGGEVPLEEILRATTNSNARRRKWFRHADRVLLPARKRRRTRASFPHERPAPARRRQTSRRRERGSLRHILRPLTAAANAARAS